MNAYLWNIVLSYCDGFEESIELINIMDDNSKVTEIHCDKFRMYNIRLFENLRVLKLSRCISDIRPLKNMKLQVLHCGSIDASKLYGMPLRELKAEDIIHLEYLKSLPLEILYINTYSGSLRHFGGMQLSELVLPDHVPFNIEPLRGMPLRVLVIDDFSCCDNTFLDVLRTLPLKMLGLLYTGAMTGENLKRFLRRT